MIKVFIFTPNLKSRGGVSNFYKIASKYFDSETEILAVNSATKIIVFKQIINLMYLLKAVFMICFYSPKTIVVNPSLGKLAIIRDGTLSFIGNLLRIKTFVFWRGWNPETEVIIVNSWINIFFNFLLKSDYQICLNKYVYYKLLDMRVDKKRILLSSTLVDDDFYQKESNRKDKNFKILFLSRIEKYKGVYETVEIFKQFSEAKKDVELIIAGDGSELEKVKRKIENENIKNIHCIGFVEGVRKQKVLSESNCYLFPSYSEGMPNSVLEAMAFGLPVLCTRVGALNDFFLDNAMGFSFALPINNHDFVTGLNTLYKDRSHCDRIGKYNKGFIEQNFLASEVVKKLQNEFNS